MSSADPEVDKSENELNEDNISSTRENSPDSREEADSVSDSASHAEEEQKEKLVQLPLGRVKTIVKMDPDVNLVNQEELFIDSLTKEAYKYTSQSKKKTVQKQDVQSAIQNVDALVFLEGMM